MNIFQISQKSLTLSLISFFIFQVHAADISNKIDKIVQEEFKPVSITPPFPKEMTKKSSDTLHKMALNLDWINADISPRENFYAFANGNWQTNNPIPPEYSRWGIFSILQEKLQNDLHKILEDSLSQTNIIDGSDLQKVRDFYLTGMDTTTIEALGITPLEYELDLIASIKDQKSLQKTIAHLQLTGVNAPFGFTSMQDFKDSQKMIGVAYQSGLGLPDRDYYIEDSPRFNAIRDNYFNHIAKMFMLTGEDESIAFQNANIIMQIETELAVASMSKVEQRDPYAIYNLMDIKKLQTLTPNFYWKKYFKNLDINVNKINLATVDFFKILNHKLTTIALNDWKVYLRWHLINSYAPYLSDNFVSQDFKMIQTLTGAEKILPRYKRVINSTNSALGFALGKLYVEKHFPEQSKQKVLTIADNIRTALKNDLKTLSWMSEDTKKAAELKLSLMDERIGYPDKWRDYSNLIIDQSSYAKNIMRANKFLIKRELDKIGKPTDPYEWEMTPPTVNAYYNPTMNSINFPAGILQPPFFDPNAPDSVNYGGIGFIIGHEITHGFDDEGGKFDGYGNLKNWWTKKDYDNFQTRASCIIDQFGQYKVVGDMHLKGKLVSGEAIADLGGLLLAYNAFINSKNYKNAKTIEKFTPEQQFFLSAAHIWASNIRDEQAQRFVLTDPHPPALYRVNGTLSNMQSFQKAFNIPLNSPMINANRCVIW